MIARGSGCAAAPPRHRTGRLREDVIRVTQNVTDALEKLIVRAPTQWHNFQPTWPSDAKAAESYS